MKTTTVTAMKKQRKSYSQPSFSTCSRYVSFQCTFRHFRFFHSFIHSSLLNCFLFLFYARLFPQDAESGGFTDVVSWGINGNTFRVHKRSEFERVILPKYFKMTKYKVRDGDQTQIAGMVFCFCSDLFILFFLITSFILLILLIFTTE